jgi:hypothetical protein
MVKLFSVRKGRLDGDLLLLDHRPLADNVAQRGWRHVVDFLVVRHGYPFLMPLGSSPLALANDKHQLIHVVGVSALMDLVRHVEFLRFQLPTRSVPIALGIGCAFPDANWTDQLLGCGSIQDCFYVVPGHVVPPFCLPPVSSS